MFKKTAAFAFLAGTTFLANHSAAQEVPRSGNTGQGAGSKVSQGQTDVGVPQFMGRPTTMPQQASPNYRGDNLGDHIAVRNLNMNNFKIINVIDPTDQADVVNLRTLERIAEQILNAARDNMGDQIARNGPVYLNGFSLLTGNRIIDPATGTLSVENGLRIEGREIDGLQDPTLAEHATNKRYVDDLIEQVNQDISDIPLPVIVGGDGIRITKNGVNHLVEVNETVLRTSGDQGISGIKEFTTIPLIKGIPTLGDHAVNLAYVQQYVANNVPTLSAVLTAGNEAGDRLIKGLGDAVDPQDAVNKRSLDAAIAGLGADNLGNHIATEALKMSGFGIVNSGSILIGGTTDAATPPALALGGQYSAAALTIGHTGTIGAAGSAASVMFDGRKLAAFAIRKHDGTNVVNILNAPAAQSHVDIYGSKALTVANMREQGILLSHGRAGTQAAQNFALGGATMAEWTTIFTAQADAANSMGMQVQSNGVGSYGIHASVRLDGKRGIYVVQQSQNTDTANPSVGIMSLARETAAENAIALAGSASLVDQTALRLTTHVDAVKYQEFMASDSLSHVAGNNVLMGGFYRNGDRLELAMRNGVVRGLALPTAGDHAANKAYVDAMIAAAGGAVTPTLSQVLAAGNDANGLKIVNLAAPTDAQDAANKAYVDAQINSASYSAGTGIHISAGRVISVTDTVAMTNLSNKFGQKQEFNRGFLISNFVSDTARKMSVTSNLNQILFQSTNAAGTGAIIDVMGLPLEAGGSVVMHVDLSMTNKRITQLATPTAGDHAANKSYVDDQVTAGSNAALQNLAQVLALGNDANGLKITNLAAPTLASDAATKAYVDSRDYTAGDDIVIRPDRSIGVAYTIPRLSIVNSFTARQLFMNGLSVGNSTPGSRQLLIENTTNQAMFVSLGATSTDKINMMGITLTGSGGINMYRGLNMWDNGISMLADPVEAQDAATKAYVDAQVTAGTNSALQNLAQVLAQGNNANGLNITNLADPTVASDAATKAYVDARVAAGGNVTTPTLVQVLTAGNDAGNLLISGLAGPVAGQDAANKSYVDTQITSAINAAAYTAGTGIQISAGRVVSVTDTVAMTNRANKFGQSQEFNRGLSISSFVSDTARKMSVTSNLNQILFQSTNAAGTGAIIDVMGMPLEAGGSVVMHVDLSMTNKRITQLAAPTAGDHAANKAYVDDQVQAGSTASLQNLAQVLALGNNANGLKIANLAAPTDGQDAANKAYVDSAIQAAGGSDNLGNHIATEVLKMGGFGIVNSGSILVGGTTDAATPPSVSIGGQYSAAGLSIGHSGTIGAAGSAASLMVNGTRLSSFNIRKHDGVNVTDILAAPVAQNFVNIYGSKALTVANMREQGVLVSNNRAGTQASQTYGLAGVASAEWATIFMAQADAVNSIGMMTQANGAGSYGLHASVRQEARRGVYVVQQSQIGDPSTEVPVGVLSLARETALETAIALGGSISRAGQTALRLTSHVDSDKYVEFQYNATAPNDAGNVMNAVLGGIYRNDQALSMRLSSNGLGQLLGLGLPVNPTDAANKAYVDAQIAAGGAGSLQNLAQVLARGNAAGGAVITGLGTPVAASDAASKAYVDGAIQAAGGSDNLGNHIATESLKMGGFGIVNSGTIMVGGTTDAATPPALSLGGQYSAAAMSIGHTGTIGAAGSAGTILLNGTKLSSFSIRKHDGATVTEIMGAPVAQNYVNLYGSKALTVNNMRDQQILVSHARSGVAGSPNFAIGGEAQAEWSNVFTAYADAANTMGMITRSSGLDSYGIYSTVRDSSKRGIYVIQHTQTTNPDAPAIGISSVATETAADNAYAISGAVSLETQAALRLATHLDARSYVEFIRSEYPVNDPAGITVSIVGGIYRADNDALEMRMNSGGNLGVISGVRQPVAANDVATKAYVDAAALSGGNAALQNLNQVLTQGNSAGGLKITGLGAPTAASDAATKAYVDGLVSAGGYGAGTGIEISAGNVIGVTTAVAMTNRANKFGQSQEFNRGLSISSFVSDTARKMSVTSNLNQILFQSTNAAGTGSIIDVMGLPLETGGMVSIHTNLNMNNRQVLNVAAPTEIHHAANKAYVDAQIAANAGIPSLAQVMAAGNSAGNLVLTGLADPVGLSDAVNLQFLMDIVESLSNSIDGMRHTQGNGILINSSRVISINPAVVMDLASAQTVSGAKTFSNGQGIRLTNGSIGSGVLFLNSGTTFSLRVSGTATGAINTLNPFSVSLSTGEVSIGHGIAMNNQKISGLSDPANPQDAATKAYVDAQVLAVGGLPGLGAVLGVSNNAGNRVITGLAAPVANSDAATKAYVDTRVAGANYTAGDGIVISPARAIVVSDIVARRDQVNTFSAVQNMNNGLTIGLQSALDQRRMQISSNLNQIMFTSTNANGLEPANVMGLSLTTNGSVNMYRAVRMNENTIQNLGEPTADHHAATKGYVDSLVATSGNTPTLAAVLTAGNAAGNRVISGLATPVALTDAATKGYVDTAVTAARDNLGNHLATQALNMNNFGVNNAGTIMVGGSTTVAPSLSLGGQYSAAAMSVGHTGTLGATGAVANILVNSTRVGAFSLRRHDGTNVYEMLGAPMNQTYITAYGSKILTEANLRNQALLISHARAGTQASQTFGIAGVTGAEWSTIFTAQADAANSFGLMAQANGAGSYGVHVSVRAASKRGIYVVQQSQTTDAGNPSAGFYTLARDSAATNALGIGSAITLPGQTAARLVVHQTATNFLEFHSNANSPDNAESGTTSQVMGGFYKSGTLLHLNMASSGVAGAITGVRNPVSPADAANKNYVDYMVSSSTSDGRLKENIQNVTNGLDIINALRPVSYDWKDGSGHAYGVIAQEVENVLPEAVVYDDENDTYRVRYDEFISPLISSVQELSQENKDLRAENEALKAQIELIFQKLNIEQ